MVEPRSLAIVVLVVASFVFTSCQTTGTAPGSEGAANSQSAAGPQAASPASNQAQAAAQPQATTPAAKAGRKAALRTGAVKQAVGTRVKSLTGGTAKTLANLYTAVTGKRVNPTRLLEYIAVGIAVVVAIGVIGALTARRHRKTTLGSRTSGRSPAAERA